MDISAISVEVAGPEGHHNTFGCHDEDAFLLRCAAKEIEGSLHCKARCTQTVLTVTHTATLPAGTPTPDLGPTACELADRILTCSYPVTLNSVAIRNTWAYGGDDHLCVTTPTGQHQIVLDDIGDMGIDTALLVTPRLGQRSLTPHRRDSATFLSPSEFWPKAPSTSNPASATPRHARLSRSRATE